MAQVEGDAYHLQDKVAEDTAFRRKVKWLNGKNPIPRDKAPSALYSRMKILGVSASAPDLVDEIRSVVEDATAGVEISFAKQLADRLGKPRLTR